MKKLLASILIVVMSGSALASTHAETLPAEQFQAPAEPGLGYYGYRSIPDFLLHFTNPYLLGMETDGRKPSVVNRCSGLDDPKCAKSDYWKFSTLLDFCTDAVTNNCIEGVSAVGANGAPLEVKPAQIFPGIRVEDYKGNIASDLPNGGQIHLVSIPGAPHVGGDLYAPVVLINGFKDSVLASPKPFTIGQIGLAFYAVTIKNGSYNTYLNSTNASVYVDRTWGFGGGAIEGCVISDANTCAAKQTLPLDVKFGIKIKTSFAIPGWFHGLFADPNIKITSDADQNTNLEISANAVQSPIFALWKKKTELPKSLMDFYAAQPQPLGGSGSGAGNMALQSGDPANWSLMFDPTGFGQFEMDQFLQWLPVFGDKATADPTYWNLFAESGSIYGRSCPVDANTITGVVSTNASRYIAGPPQWDPASETLDYRVAAAHYMASGEVFKGTYDLAINADYARCLYGFTKAPIKATVSIVSNSGENSLATTTIREADGFLYLAAKGFTFSNPTIKVKLSQEAPPAPVAPVVTPTVAPVTPLQPVAPVISQPKKITITCIKGKTTKKVSALKPICPAGYKRK